MTGFIERISNMFKDAPTKVVSLQPPPALPSTIKVGDVLEVYDGNTIHGCVVEGFTMFSEGQVSIINVRGGYIRYCDGDYMLSKYYNHSPTPTVHKGSVTLSGMFYRYNYESPVTEILQWIEANYQSVEFNVGADNKVCAFDGTSDFIINGVQIGKFSKQGLKDYEVDRIISAAQDAINKQLAEKAATAREELTKLFANNS